MERKDGVLEIYYRDEDFFYSGVNPSQVVKNADALLLKYKLPKWIGICSTTRGLDVGCGTGVWLFQFLKQTTEFYGLDVSDKQLVVAKSMIKGFSSLAATGKLMKVSATMLPFRKESFDVVCIIHLLEHLPKPSYCLKEVYRILKPRGRLYVEVPNLYDFYSPIKFGAKILKILPEKIASKTALRLVGKEFVKSKYFNEHLYKCPFSLSWINLIRGHGFEILRIRMNTIFPPIYEIPKIGLDMCMFNRIKFIKRIDDAICSKFPFKYLGHSTMILAEKCNYKRRV